MKQFRWFVFLLFFSFGIIYAETSRNPEGVYIKQNLEQTIDLNLSFLDENGRKVQLKEFFKDKPIIIAPAYYECPRLCTLVYNGLKNAIESAKFIEPGKDYKIISLSFNPEDTPALAKEKAENYRKNLKNYTITDQDWIFLVADPQNPENPKKLLNQMGYFYKKDGRDFSHPAAIIFLTPEGKISKYLYGIEFQSRDFRFALIEASQGKIGTPVDAVLLTCFRYDSIQGKYAPFAWGFMRLGGMVILVFILGLISILIFLERKSKKENLNLK